jgi:hypothetical protein
MRIECIDLTIARVFLRAICKLGYHVQLELKDGSRVAGYIKSVTHNALYTRSGVGIRLDTIECIMVADA